MLCHTMLAIASLCSTASQAYAPIQMVSSGQGKGLVVLPKGFPGNMRGAPNLQHLSVRILASNSPSAVPYFTANLDQTITWDGMGWCLEATGNKHGDVVRVNSCSGAQTQKWNWIPDGRGHNMIQLRDTELCLDAIDKAIGSKGVEIELRGCGNQVSKWQFEQPPPFPIILQGGDLSYDARHVMITVLTLVGLGAVSLGARIWQVSATGDQDQKDVWEVMALDPMPLSRVAHARASRTSNILMDEYKSPPAAEMAVLLVGFGYCARHTVAHLRALGYLSRNVKIFATTRDCNKVAVSDKFFSELHARDDTTPANIGNNATAPKEAHVRFISFHDSETIGRILGGMEAKNVSVVASAPPARGVESTEERMVDPFLQSHYELMMQSRHLEHVVYLSTTGVYGERQGGWVDENSPLADLNSPPAVPRVLNRIRAEREWLSLSKHRVTILRLPGIYGGMISLEQTESDSGSTMIRGRNALTSLKDGQEKHSLQKEGIFFPRVYVKDIARIVSDLLLVTNLKDASGNCRHDIYNLSDDYPTDAVQVKEFAAKLLGIEPSPVIMINDENADTLVEQGIMSRMMLEFYSSSKRVCNGKAKSAFGPFAYPTFKEGLEDIFSNQNY